MSQSSALAGRLIATVARHDGWLFDKVASWRRPLLSRLMIGATRSGDMTSYVFVGIAGLALHGESSQALVAMAVSAALASSLGWIPKRLIARPRPSRASAARAALLDHPDAYSFPSSHTAAAMAAALAFAEFCPAAGPMAVLWASCVAISRVYVGAHYPLDVVMGAALGIATHATCGGLRDSILRALGV